MNNKIKCKEIEDFYTGHDLSVDHFLIRCARETELFSHLNNNLVGTNVFDEDKLLVESFTEYYRSRIKEYNLQLKTFSEMDKKTKKNLFELKKEELKNQLYKLKANRSDKYKQAKKELKKFKALGYEGYNEQNISKIRTKMVDLGDGIIESEDFAEKRNAEIREFFKALPNVSLEHEYKEDWKEISSPNGYDTFFGISENQFSSREKYLKTVLRKLQHLNFEKRKQFEKTMLECAEKRANEETIKNKFLSARIDKMRKCIWSWSSAKDYPEIVTIAIKKINSLVAKINSTEMLQYSKTKTRYMLNTLYVSSIRDINIELENEYEM